MKHTYLFEEGVWNASGVFIDETGKEFQVEGKSTISHEESIWKNRGFMRIHTDPPTEYQSSYEIEPFESGCDSTKWVAQNPDIGQLSGNFVVIGDSILSIYTSENDKLVGTEYLRQINENVYENRGTLMRGNVRISSWSVELKRG